MIFLLMEESLFLFCLFYIYYFMTLFIYVAAKEVKTGKHSIMSYGKLLIKLQYCFLSWDMLGK